jgi:D-glycero-D-manno-heptose 1,7-bisphosphate phosphatase
VALTEAEIEERIRSGCPGEQHPVFAEGKPRPTAFLDRDGVINKDRGYVHRIEDIELMPDAIEAIEDLKKAGWWVVVVTNQSGVGCGLYTEEEFREISRWMLRRMPIDVIFCCLHDPEDRCPARKPGTTMLESAERVLPIDKSMSFLVGDKLTDIQAAEAFGIPGHRYDGGSLLSFVRRACAELGA